MMALNRRCPELTRNNNVFARKATPTRTPTLKQSEIHTKSTRKCNSSYYKCDLIINRVSVFRQRLRYNEQVLPQATILEPQRPVIADASLEQQSKAGRRRHGKQRYLYTPRRLVRRTRTKGINGEDTQLQRSTEVKHLYTHTVSGTTAVNVNTNGRRLSYIAKVAPRS